MVFVSINKGEQEPVIKAAATLPAVAVISQRLPAPVAPVTVSHASAGYIPASHAMAEAPDTSVLPAAIGDAQAAIIPPPAQTLPEKPGATIRLRDHSSVIVGQLAKIPLQSEPITEVRAINDVDNGSGHELLSIVGKY